MKHLSGLPYMGMPRQAWDAEHLIDRHRTARSVTLTDEGGRFYEQIVPLTGRP